MIVMGKDGSMFEYDRLRRIFFRIPDKPRSAALATGVGIFFMLGVLIGLAIYGAVVLIAGIVANY